MPAMHPPYGHQPYPVPPGGADPGQAAELAGLRAVLKRFRTRFAIANGACFTVTLLLTTTAGGLLGTGVLGSRITVGLLLGTLQGTVLLVTAWRYDRLTARYADPRAEALRAHAELQVAAHRHGGFGAGPLPGGHRGVGR